MYGLAGAGLGADSGPGDFAMRRFDQTMAKAQEQALAGAIGPKYERPRAAPQLHRNAIDQPPTAGLETDVVQPQWEDAR